MTVTALRSEPTPCLIYEVTWLHQFEGEKPWYQKGFSFSFVVLKHLVLLAGLSISRTWPLYYGCHLCNNRPHPDPLAGEGHFGFYLFHAWQWFQVALAVLLRLISNPNGCSTGIISTLFETDIPPFLTMKQTYLANRQSQHAPRGLFTPPPGCNLISSIIHGSCKMQWLNYTNFVNLHNLTQVWSPDQIEQEPKTLAPICVWPSSTSHSMTPFS